MKPDRVSPGPAPLPPVKPSSLRLYNGPFRQALGQLGGTLQDPTKTGAERGTAALLGVGISGFAVLEDAPNFAANLEQGSQHLTRFALGGDMADLKQGLSDIGTGLVPLAMVAEWANAGRGLRGAPAVESERLEAGTLPAKLPATFGTATSSNYRATFFEANPGTEGQVVVHHAVEQQVLTRYPGVVTESQIHSLQNLRGIPKPINAQVHLCAIRKSWNQFYRTNPSPTANQLLEHATKIDDEFGHMFDPPIRD